MPAPLVSVIVPAYQHENYILECLRSIGKQSHPRLELIVIDDASPDATFARAQALLSMPFAARFESVTLRRKNANRGPDDSLNLGIEAAQGEFIALINSDDRFKPTRIERLLEAVRREGSEFAFSGVETIVEANVGAAETPRLPEELILLRLRQLLAVARDRSIGYALLRGNIAISTGNFFFSRSLARKIGGFQPLKYCHDWDFVLQALLRTEPVFVAEPLYEYRLHPTNSFRALKHVAVAETDAVLRRFFHGLVNGKAHNPRCPGPDHDWSYFEAFVEQANYRRLWAKEANLPLPGERMCEPRAAKEFGTLSSFAMLLDFPVDNSGRHRQLVDRTENGATR